VYPTGTLIYKPEKCWNGYNLIGPSWWGDASTYLVDMNGNIVKEWKGLIGHSAKMLPNGHIMGQYGSIKKAYAHQLDWDGNIVRSYKGAYMSHDMNKESFPAGYYSPASKPTLMGGRVLLNAQFQGKKGVRIWPKVMKGAPTQGNFILELDWDGNILWEWNINDHFDELGFSPTAKEAIQESYKQSYYYQKGYINYVDWAHINTMSWVGPNKWYDQGDERFHPDNVLWASRETSIIAITSRKTGKIVWQIGPDYGSNPKLRKMGPIIGSHGGHIIPKGLRGAGNLLVFDNGGQSVYGTPVPGALHGKGIARRHYSRILEINPVTLEVVWEYTAQKAKHGTKRTAHQFFSPYQSNVQRLPNGNTFITEASYGRLFELTPDFEIVWEFVDPKWRQPGDENPVFRGYRVPYEWVPQLTKPVEKAVTPPSMKNFQFEARGKEVAKPILAP